MIPWWVALLAFIAGEIAGVIAFRFLTMNEKHKYIK